MQWKCVGDSHYSFGRRNKILIVSRFSTRRKIKVVIKRFYRVYCRYTISTMKHNTVCSNYRTNKQCYSMNPNKRNFVNQEVTRNGKPRFYLAIDIWMASSIVLPKKKNGDCVN